MFDIICIERCIIGDLPKVNSLSICPPNAAVEFAFPSEAQLSLHTWPEGCFHPLHFGDGRTSTMGEIPPLSGHLNTIGDYLVGISQRHEELSNRTKKLNRSSAIIVVDARRKDSEVEIASRPSMRMMPSRH